jgi:hypothetical protein
MSLTLEEEFKMRFRLKRKNVISLFALAALFTIVIGSAIPAGAATVNGDYTFTIKQTQDEKGASAAGPYTLKAHITPMNGSAVYYLFEGRITGLTSVPYISGSGMVVGSNIIFTLNLAQNDTTEASHMGAVLQVVVNTTTLKGTYWWVGSKFKVTTTTSGVTRVFKDKYSYGTVTPAN